MRLAEEAAYYLRGCEAGDYDLHCSEEARGIERIWKRANRNDRGDMLLDAISDCPGLVCLVRSNAALASWVVRVQERRLALDTESVAPLVALWELVFVRRHFDRSRKRAGRRGPVLPHQDWDVGSARQVVCSVIGNVLKAERVELLREAMQQLPLIDRRMIELRWHEELTLKDIGQAVDLSPSTVSVRLRKAYEALLRYILSRDAGVLNRGEGVA